MGQLNSKSSLKDPTIEVLRKLAGHLSRALKRPNESHRLNVLRIEIPSQNRCFSAEQGAFRAIVSASAGRSARSASKASTLAPVKERACARFLIPNSRFLV